MVHLITSWRWWHTSTCLYSHNLWLGRSVGTSPIWVLWHLPELPDASPPLPHLRHAPQVGCLIPNPLCWRAIQFTDVTVRSGFGSSTGRSFSSFCLGCLLRATDVPNPELSPQFQLSCSQVQIVFSDCISLHLLHLHLLLLTPLCH